MKKIIYHGSERIVRRPIFGYGKPYNDYGLGFYCTENADLAKEWSVDEDRDGFANTYEIEMDGLEVLDLASEKFCILHWLSVLLANREFELDTELASDARDYVLAKFPVDTSKADIILGWRADDSYFTFARNFLSGAITLGKLGEAMRLGKLGTQFVLKSRKAFDRIMFIGAVVAKAADWFPLKKGRDDEARRTYRDMRAQRERNGLYIPRIMDEEMGPDELRI
jgi:hypothetical protein